MRFSSLPEWLSWLEQHHPQEIDLGLERVAKVARRLDLPGPSARLVIAGTNGKGSCVAASTALLQAAGYRVGSFTSPHLQRYNERICIDGQPVADELICCAFAAIDKARADISLTYFEFGTLAALWVFRQQAVNISVLEIGLGGRLDAVNLVDADVTVVTSIDVDHEQWLGSDRGVIGREKAGIFRPGVPALCADPTAPSSVEDYAREIGALWMPVGQVYTYHVQSNGDWQWQCESETYSNLPAVSLPLPSVAVALMAVRCLGVELHKLPLNQCLAELRLSGRLQKVIYRDREILLDVAHNPAATRYLAERLSERPVTGKSRAIVAMMTDKDIPASLSPMMALVDAWAVASLPQVPRAASTDLLRTHLQALGGQVEAEGALADLLDTWLPFTDKEDLLLVFGSFFTVAAALAIVGAEDNLLRTGM